MIAPKEAALYLCWATAFGVVLGVWYAFLRPLRRKLLSLSDGLFVLGLLFAWLVFSFGICDGAPGLGYWLGALLGFWVGEKILGKVLSPIFSLFWKVFLGFFMVPAGFFCKIFKKLAGFMKKLFAYGKKSATIKCTKQHRAGIYTGGKRHGKSLSPHSSGLQTHAYGDQDCVVGGYCVFYGDTADHSGSVAGMGSP